MQRIKLLFILWVLLSFLNSFGQTNEIKNYSGKSAEY